jgi:hypothetical protein
MLGVGLGMNTVVMVRLTRYVMVGVVYCKWFGLVQTQVVHGLGWSTVYGPSRSTRDRFRRTKFEKIEFIPPLAPGSRTPRDGTGTVLFGNFIFLQTAKKIDIS